MSSFLDQFVINDSREKQKPYGCPAVVKNGWRREHVSTRAIEDPGGLPPEAIDLKVPSTLLYSGAQIVSKAEFRYGTFEATVSRMGTERGHMRAMFLYGFRTEDEIDIEYLTGDRLRFTLYRGAKKVAQHECGVDTAWSRRHVRPLARPVSQIGIVWTPEAVIFTRFGEVAWTTATAIATPMHLIFSAFEATYHNPDGHPHGTHSFTIYAAKLPEMAV